MHKIEVKFTADRFARNTFYILLALEVLVVVLDIVFCVYRVTNLSPIRRFLDMTREESVGTWVSSMLFLLIGVQCFLLSLSIDPNESKWRKLDWYVFSVFFIFLSIDDAARIHERFGSAFAILVDKSKPDTFLYKVGHWFPSYYWQLLYMPLLATMALCLFLLIFLKSKDSFLKLTIFLGFGLLGFSQCIDFVEGLDPDYRMIRDLFSIRFTTADHFVKIFEEFLEMLGLTVIFFTLQSYFLKDLNSISIKFEESA